MGWLLNILMIAVSRKVSFSIREDMFQRLAHMPVGFFDTHSTGDIISRISYDVDTLNASLSSDLVQVMTSAITIVRRPGNDAAHLTYAGAGFCRDGPAVRGVDAIHHQADAPTIQ